VPFVVNVTEVVPVRFAFTAIAPFVPACIASVPEAVIVLPIVILPVAPALSVSEKFAPVDTPLPVIACVSTNVTLPVVLAVTFGVVSVNDPIVPEPVVSATDVVPVTVPVPVIVPVVDAVIVSAVPETLALITIPAVAVVASKLKLLLAVIPLLTVIAPTPAAVSVKLNIAPVDAPETVTAPESVTYTLPLVLATRFGALVSILAPVVPIVPEVDDIVNVPVVDMFVAAV